MLSPVKKIITASIIGCLALSNLSGCVVSNDPNVNAAATAAAVSMIIYSISDGFYYDQSYNRMPRHYRPPQHVKVVRVKSINDYRKSHYVIKKQERKKIYAHPKHVHLNKHVHQPHKRYQAQYQPHKHYRP